MQQKNGMIFFLEGTKSQLSVNELNYLLTFSPFAAVESNLKAQMYKSII